VPTDLDDIAQEVFLRLLRYDRGENVSDPRAYLFKIAGNVASEWSMRARQRLPHESSWLDDLIDETDIAEEMERSERYSQLYSALGSLPARVREILRLHFGEALTHEAIATRLGVTRRVVKRDIVRAYASLRSALSLPEDRQAESEVNVDSALGNEL
jgi:RNA polymerase sigma factor (sigma-70 family)